MANLLIGDIHGCYNEFMRVLEKAKCSDSDTIWLTGDVVARGPDSLSVLRFIYNHRAKIRMVLGNHDLHLLAIHSKIVQKHSKKDHLDNILTAHDGEELMEWLRHQPLLQIDRDLKLMMVHAGISPDWDLDTAENCANLVQKVLSSPDYPIFLDTMYGDYPDRWSSDLKGFDLLRYSTNVLTRMRYCYKDGRLDFYIKESPTKVGKPLYPWFILPSKIPKEYSIVFGHWASLNGKGTPDNIYGLDTGCCWGGKLTCLRFEDKTYFKKRNKSIEKSE